jgi:hypothetical protein
LPAGICNKSLVLVFFFFSNCTHPAPPVQGAALPTIGCENACIADLPFDIAGYFSDPRPHVKGTCDKSLVLAFFFFLN